MKKEVVIAVLIGLTLGLFITYGLYTARKSLLKSSNPATTFLPEETPQASNTSTLLITSPADETVTTQAELTVTGTTLANSYVVILVNDNETITTADETGNFSTKIQLSAGGNIVSVHALDENGQETIEERSVVYLTPELEATPAASAAATATSSSKTASPKPR